LDDVSAKRIDAASNDPTSGFINLSVASPGTAATNALTQLVAAR
jgi:hypothetical protein